MCAASPTIPAIPIASFWAPAPDSSSFRRTGEIRGRFSAHLGPGDDYVFDHVVFDPTNPATVYAAAWGLFDDNDGGVFRSDDGGRTWRELMGVHGKSIRALAMAPSDHNTLVIGALDGVFRSRDGGATWERISPENPISIENHSSLKNFVSVAIDPQNPDIMYAGTRHLPWKTTNGGRDLAQP